MSRIGFSADACRAAIEERSAARRLRRAYLGRRQASVVEFGLNCDLPLHSGLPLFVFANCTYPLGTERESFDGRTSTYTITSREQVHLPTEWKLENLKTLATSDEFLP